MAASREPRNPRQQSTGSTKDTLRVIVISALAITLVLLLQHIALRPVDTRFLLYLFILAVILIPAGYVWFKTMESHVVERRPEKGVESKDNLLDRPKVFHLLRGLSAAFFALCLGLCVLRVLLGYPSFPAIIPTRVAVKPTDTQLPAMTLTSTPTGTQLPTTTPTPTDTDTPVPPTDTPIPPTDTPIPLSVHWIYDGSRLAKGYDMGVNTSGGRTDWVRGMDGYMCMDYPSGQSWGAVFITVGSPRDFPRPGTDLSAYGTLSIELRGEAGGEYVWVGLKDNTDPDNGQETKIPVQDLTTDWQTRTFPLSDFTTADSTRLHVVTEFVFEPGTPAKTVCFRRIQYLP